MITCLSCLRSSSVRTRDIKTGVVLTSTCLHCGTDISYRLDSTAVTEPDKITADDRMRASLESSHRAVADSQQAIAESKARIAKRHD